MVADRFGEYASITFFPCVVHVRLERSQSLCARGPFAPIGTCVGEHARSFERGENKMDSGGVRDDVVSASLSGKLLYVGDPSVEHLHTLVGIPFRSETSTVVLQRFFRYNVIGVQ